MAHTAGTTYGTEFAGAHKTVTVLVDAGTQTGTVSFTGLTTIRGAQVTLKEAPTATAAIAVVNSISGTNVVVSEYTTNGTLCTQTALDFYLTVIGEY
jgi:hypothetical protein